MMEIESYVINSTHRAAVYVLRGKFLSVRLTSFANIEFFISNAYPEGDLTSIFIQCTHLCEKLSLNL